MSIPAFNWRLRGTCTPADLHLFFGPDREDPGTRAAREAQAVTVCRRCPAELACLEWHLGFRTQHGVAGGTGEDERRALRNARLKRQHRAERAA